MISTDNISNSDENLLLLSFLKTTESEIQNSVLSYSDPRNYRNSDMCMTLPVFSSQLSPGSSAYITWFTYICLSVYSNKPRNHNCDKYFHWNTTDTVTKRLNIIIGKIVGHLKYFTLYPTSFCFSWFRYSTDNCFIWSSAASCFSSRSLQTFFSLSFYKNENECW